MLLWQLCRWVSGSSSVLFGGSGGSQGERWVNGSSGFTWGLKVICRWVRGDNVLGGSTQVGRGPTDWRSGLTKCSRLLGLGSSFAHKKCTLSLAITQLTPLKDWLEACLGAARPKGAVQWSLITKIALPSSGQAGWRISVYNSDLGILEDRWQGMGRGVMGTEGTRV